MPFFNNNRRPYRDAKPKTKRRIKKVPPPAKQAEIVGLDGSRVRFFSVKNAKRALAGLIATLSPKKSPDEPKKFWIEK